MSIFPASNCFSTLALRPECRLDENSRTSIPPKSFTTRYRRCVDSTEFVKHRTCRKLRLWRKWSISNGLSLAGHWMKNSCNKEIKNMIGNTNEKKTEKELCPSLPHGDQSLQDGKLLHPLVIAQFLLSSSRKQSQHFSSRGSCVTVEGRNELTESPAGVVYFPTNSPSTLAGLSSGAGSPVSSPSTATRGADVFFVDMTDVNSFGWNRFSCWSFSGFWDNVAENNNFWGWKKLKFR